GRSVAGALDEVAFPMARDQAIGDLGRTHVDAPHVRNLAAPIRAARSWLAAAAPLAKTRNELCTQLAARQHVDRAVDGFVRHAAVCFIRKGPAQYPRHLLRRPAFPQMLADHVE